MKEELEILGIKLAKLAKKHGEDYLTITYMEGSVHVDVVTHTKINIQEFI